MESFKLVVVQNFDLENLDLINNNFFGFIGVSRIGNKRRA